MNDPIRILREKVTKLEADKKELLYNLRVAYAYIDCFQSEIESTINELRPWKDDLKSILNSFSEEHKSSEFPDNSVSS